MPDKHLDPVISYAASAVAWMQGCDWMLVGSAILLISRLLIDIPKTIRVLKGWFNNGKS